jgi:hypothetical protein
MHTYDPTWYSCEILTMYTFSEHVINAKHHHSKGQLGQPRNEVHVHLNAFQENVLLQVLIVIMSVLLASNVVMSQISALTRVHNECTQHQHTHLQQDGRRVNRRKAKGRHTQAPNVPRVGGSRKHLQLNGDSPVCL